MSDRQSGFRALEQVLPNLRQALSNLQFGVIEIQIHDFRVVRITRTERLRVMSSAIAPGLASETSRPEARNGIHRISSDADGSQEFTLST